MMFSSVDLPQPDGPTMQRNSDCSMLKLALCRRRSPGRPACHRPATRRGFRCAAFRPGPFPRLLAFCCSHYARFCIGIRPAFGVAGARFRCTFRATRPVGRTAIKEGSDGTSSCQADKITSQMTLSERADHLEEQMMHELDQVVTKSVFSHLTDGQVEMEGGAALQAKYPGKYFNMGAGPAAAADAGQADAAGLLQAPLRLDQPSAAERRAGAEERPQREGRAGLPAARHRGGELHPLRPRLLGRADDRALRRRGGERGDPHAPGAALLPRRVGGLRLSRHVREVLRRRLPARALHRRGVQARPRPASTT